MEAPFTFPTVVTVPPAALVASPVRAGICAAVTPVLVVINVDGKLVNSAALTAGSWPLAFS
jgi:hypothetical protein